MAKIYTAKEMREKAEALELASGCKSIAAMLRQAADALDREKQIIEEVSKIDTMKVVPLDGHPMHQQTNAKRVAAILEFFTKMKKIIGGVKSLEREEKCEKKYEYAVFWRCDNQVANNMGEHRNWAESIVRDVGANECKLVRREVSEWEEVE